MSGPVCAVSWSRSAVLRPLCAIAAALAIAALAGCTTKPASEGPPAPTAQAAPEETGPITQPNHALSADSPSFLRLSNMPAGRTPVRIGILLPFSNGSAQTRALAQSMLKAAELSLFDAHNPDIVLMSADEGSSPATALGGARQLLDQGAEIIIGPLFAASVTAIAPLARDRAVPVIAFSTDRKAGGDGVYLLSFQPENEIRRIVAYAADHGSANFAALIPQSAYGNRIVEAFQQSVEAKGGKVVGIERFSATGENIAAASTAVAAEHPDAILIADGGANLRGIVPSLAGSGIDRTKVRLLGTGLWNDANISRDPALQGSWFPAPAPYADDAFNTKYKDTFAGTAPQLATLAYDAVALVALLASGQPYHRFTREALTDPNGFAGVNGIFRFHADGSSERGLAVLGVGGDGASLVDPAPRTFQTQGS